MNAPSKIFSAVQIKRADQYTIQHEPITSINLMERAATKCSEWIQQHFSKEKTFIIICGPGNNGGDGLAITRLLHQNGYQTKAFIVEINPQPSEDFIINEKRLEELDASLVNPIVSVNDFPSINENDIIIDAIFGTGLSKPVTGLAADIISRINDAGVEIISIDLPSGLFADTTSDDSLNIIKADHTLSFQFPKLAFFFPENASYTGNWEILDIGLSQTFINEERTTQYIITKEFIKNIVRPRPKFSNKGTFGHALLIEGSYGKIGAAVLSAKACLRSGVGLLTMHLPKCGYEIMQLSNPEAMVSADKNETLISGEIDSQKYSAVGIGPGIGTDESTQQTLHHLLVNHKKPLIIDADALNILSLHKDWLKDLPRGSILTPHPKEFERLTEKTVDDFQKHALQIAFSKQYKVFIILKGAHTCITTPSGDCYFNTTGNPGMAKGGSGDVLTGIITGILAQGYDPLPSCLISVFVHGYAGDLAKETLGETGMTAGDLCDFLPEAFKQLYAPAN